MAQKQPPQPPPHGPLSCNGLHNRIPRIHHPTPFPPTHPLLPPHPLHHRPNLHRQNREPPRNREPSRNRNLRRRGRALCRPTFTRRKVRRGRALCRPTFTHRKVRRGRALCRPTFTRRKVRRGRALCRPTFTHRKVRRGRASCRPTFTHRKVRRGRALCRPTFTHRKVLLCKHPQRQRPAPTPHSKHHHPHHALPTGHILPTHKSPNPPFPHPPLRHLGHIQHHLHLHLTKTSNRTCRQPTNRRHIPTRQPDPGSIQQHPKPATHPNSLRSNSLTTTLRERNITMHKTVVINIVGLTPGLLGPSTPHLLTFAEQGKTASITPTLPAVT